MGSRARRPLRFPPPSSGRDSGGLSPATRIRIAADTHRHSTSDDDSGCILEEYAWVPSGLKPDMVHMYFSCLPEDKVPYFNSAGEKWRQRQLRYQLPPQDSDARYCAKLSMDEETELRAFERGRKQECLGRGIVECTPYDGTARGCGRCHSYIEEGEVAVFAPRTDRWFHPACFTCQQCEALLVDLVFFSHEGKVFCGRHHAEQIKPRCTKCDELIFADECTEAEGRTWHLHHFQCGQCGEILGGRRYMPRNGKSFCMDCYHSIVPSMDCASCMQRIPDEQPHISQGDLNWHAAERCFSCCVCHKNLLGKKYSLQEGNLYCGPRGCKGNREEERVGRTERVQTRKHRERRSSQPRSERSIRPPSSRPPRPPSIKPPPPPAESIYETVLPCGSSSPECLKECSSETDIHNHNYYSKTPNKLQRRDTEPVYDGLLYSTSSDSSDEDDQFYISSLLTAASLNRNRKPQASAVKIARTKRQNRCIVS